MARCYGSTFSTKRVARMIAKEQHVSGGLGVQRAVRHEDHWHLAPRQKQLPKNALIRQVVPA